MSDDESAGFRSGFVCLVGRPNTGKSTLTNALVGSRIVIASDRPETTRSVVRGIVDGPDYQIVVVDTPGVHRPRTLLGQRLNDRVDEALAGVDVVAACFPADQRPGPGDRRIAAAASSHAAAKRVAVVTKADSVSRDELAAALVGVSELADWDEIVPVSALEGSGVAELRGVLASLLPPAPALYPRGAGSDQSVQDRVADLIREAALGHLVDELPHSLAVLVDEMSQRGDGARAVLDVHARLVVERDSQKGIVIGRGGARLRGIGAAARPAVESLLGSHVFLHLRVVVARNWQTSPKQLGRLGF